MQVQVVRPLSKSGHFHHLLSQNQYLGIEKRLENPYKQKMKTSHSTQKSPLTPESMYFRYVFCAPRYVCPFPQNVLHTVRNPSTQSLTLHFANLFPLASDPIPQLTSNCPYNWFVQITGKKNLVMFLYSLLLQHSPYFNDLTY